MSDQTNFVVNLLKMKKYKSRQYNFRMKFSTNFNLSFFYLYASYNLHYLFVDGVDVRSRAISALSQQSFRVEIMFHLSFL